MDGKDGTDSKGDGTADKSPDALSADDGSSDAQAAPAGPAPTLQGPPDNIAQPADSTVVSPSKVQPEAGPQTLKRRARRLGRSVRRIWSELPTACKATLIVAVINFVLSITYAIGAVALTTADEELHITLIILISAVFVVFSVADAIIYENTLELATSVVIDTLVLARVIFFAFEGSSHAAFKIGWCTLMLVVQTIYMVVAVLAYREFGWRLYSKLGVDFREKGAADKMRMAIMRNSYATLLKVTGMLLVVLCALGIDVAVEKRGGDVLVQLLVVSLVGLALGGAAIALAVVLVLARRERAAPLPLLLAFHVLMPLSVGQGVATVALYNLEGDDVANASISLHVSSVIYIVFGSAVWLSTHLLYRKQERDRKTGGPGAPLSTATRSNAASAVDPLLAPMQAGAWIGKPTAASPRKVRFFQLSYDGSTLRWGWNKFVRLYYVEDLACDDLALSITLAFPFEAELQLKFRDAATYHAWRRGLAHLLLMLMAPDARAPHESGGGGGGSSGGGGGPHHASGRVLLGQTTSRQLLGVPSRATMALVTGSGGSAAAPSAAASDASLGGARGSVRGQRALAQLGQLGVRVQEMGRLFRSTSLGKPRPSDGSWSQGPEGGEASAAWDEEAGSGSAGRRTASLSLRTPRRSAAAAPRDGGAAEKGRREAEHGQQLEKRRRMAAYLRSLAAAVQPAAAERRPGGRPPPIAAAVLASAESYPAAAAEPLGAAGSGAAPSPARRPAMVEVGVQTDESELLELARLDAQRLQRSPGSEFGGPDAPPSSRRLPREAEESSGTPARDAGGDADVAAQYAAAMAAAAGAAAAGQAGQGPGTEAAPQQQQQQQQQQQDALAGGDADVAVQYAAAMAAAAGGGAALQPPTPEAQQQQQQAPGGDADLASHYMAAMAAAAGGGGSGAVPAAPPTIQATASSEAEADLAAQYLAAMQAAVDGGGGGAAAALAPVPASSLRGSGLDGWAAGGATPRGLPPRRSLSITASLGASASPLEQLVWQQQQAASARLAASLTPGSGPLSIPFSPAGGGGLWQLAAAVDVIDYEELTFGKLLGAGAEGAVYAAWFLESPVAVKRFERAADSLHEVGMYLQLGSHDNVVALRGLCQHEGSMYLVLEYCPRGTLDVMLHHSARGRWDPAKLLPLVRSIARGMHYLHSRSILHRDLKPANIFVGHGQMMKIGDFGMARIASTQIDGPPSLRRLTPGTVGTVQYCAPELVNEELRPQGVEDMEWALKLDVWSFGVTLWEILERRRPFEGLSQNAVQAQWMADPYAARLPPVRLPDGGGLPAKRIHRGLSDLIEDCTRLDPYARPSSRDILLRLKSLAAFAERRDTAHEEAL